MALSTYIKWMWIGIGVIAVYEIVTKTTWLGSAVRFVQDQGVFNIPMPGGMMQPEMDQQTPLVQQPQPQPSQPPPTTPSTGKKVVKRNGMTMTQPPRGSGVMPGTQMGQPQSVASGAGWHPAAVRNKNSSNPACGDVSYEGDHKTADSCRLENDNLGKTDYTINASFSNIQMGSDAGHDSGAEITSGGEYGHDDQFNCCAIGMGIRVKSGKPYIQVENWSQGAKGRDDNICDDGRSRQQGVMCSGNFGSLIGKNVVLSQNVRHMGGDVIYTGTASINGGAPQVFAVAMNPKPLSGQFTGQTVDPAKPLQGNVNIGRIRIDGSGKDVRMSANDT